MPTHSLYLTTDILTTIPEVPNIVTFCSESIKKPTIIKVIEQIIEYHEEFVPIYEKYDLDTSVLELTDYIKKKA